MLVLLLQLPPSVVALSLMPHHSQRGLSPMWKRLLQLPHHHFAALLLSFEATQPETGPMPPLLLNLPRSLVALRLLWQLHQKKRAVIVH